MSSMASRSFGGSQRMDMSEDIYDDGILGLELDLDIVEAEDLFSLNIVISALTISVNDNIIPEPDIALELGKSISLTEAAEEEAARQVHATHARIVTEYVPKPARRRPSGIAFRDDASVIKKMSPDLSQKLKGAQTLTPGDQLADDTIQALKESKKTNRRQPGTGGSSEGTGVSPGVPNESIVIPATSSEGTGTKPGVLDEEKVDTNEEEEKNDDDDTSINLKHINDEEIDDEFVHGEEHVQDNDEESDDEFVHGFGDQFLKLSSDTSLIGTVKDTTNAYINSLLDVKIQQEIQHIQSSSVLIVPVSVIFEPPVLTPIPETPSVALATTLLPPPSVSTIALVPLQSTTPIPAL
nr:hypothetical protein [Tanacetum cinerariifolium]